MLRDQKGSVLIAAIVTIAVMGLLMAAMATFLPTSSWGPLNSYASKTAYYMAESGYRYAASQFIHASTGTTAQAQATKFQELATLNGLQGSSAVTVKAGSGTAGKFALTVTPYFLTFSNGYSSTSNSLSVALQYPGTAPASAYQLPNNAGTGKFYLDVSTTSQPYIVSYTSYSLSNNVFTMTISSTYGGTTPAIPTQVYAYNSVRYATPLPSSATSSVTVNQGGSLTLANAAPFPSTNGTFRTMSGVIFAYQSKSGNTLQNITYSDSSNPGNNMPFTVNPSSSGSNNYIICNEYIQIASTGSVSSGSTTLSDTVNYYVPIGFVQTPNTGSTSPSTPTLAGSADTMSSNTDTVFLSAASLGSATFNVTDPANSGNKYLQMTTVGGFNAWLQDLAGSGSWALLPLNNSVFNSLTSAWNSGNHYYEAQAKISTSTSNPDYLAGINFRLQQSGSSYLGYGISFAYFPSGPNVSSDGIPNGLVPSNSQGQITGKPMVLLWELTSSGYNWMAYQILPSGIADSSDSGIKNWTTLLVSVNEIDTGGSPYNLIRAYYGTATNQGTGPNSVPTDNNSGSDQLWSSASPSPNWVPLDATTTDWTTGCNGGSCDNYTLVKWTAVNSSSSATVYAVASNDTAETGCVIQDSTFTTGASGALTSPEIALHVAGSSNCTLFNCNTINIGFDDFAVGALSGYTIGFTTPIEQ